MTAKQNMTVFVDDAGSNVKVTVFTVKSGRNELSIEMDLPKVSLPENSHLLEIAEKVMLAMIDSGWTEPSDSV